MLLNLTVGDKVAGRYCKWGWWPLRPVLDMTMKKNIWVGNPTPVARARGSYRVQYGAGIMLISFEGCIMSTDAVMITARIETDTHEKGFTGSDEMLRLILKTLAHCFRSLNDTRITRCFQMCEKVQISVVPTNSSPVAPYCQQSSAPRRTRTLLLPCGDRS